MPNTSVLVVSFACSVCWLNASTHAQCDRDSLFGFPSGIGSSGGVARIAIADLDSDGDLDIAYANRDNGTISVRLNNGSGLFGQSSYYPAGEEPLGLAAGDIDGDGDADLVVTNLNDRNIIVYFNNGDGQFPKTTSYDVGFGPIDVIMEDFDNDGSLDIAVANATSESISILINNGTGEFSNTAFIVPNDARSLAAGDFNGDGNPDLACVLFSFSGDDLYLYSGDGNGGFSFTASYDAGDRPRTIACGDLNGDGHLDLTVGDGFDRNVHFFINDGTGAMSPQSLPINTSNSDTHIADVDNDGVADLIASLQGVNEKISVFFGDGDLAFAQYDYPAPAQFGLVRWLFTADMNGDGELDIIRTTDSGAGLFLNACSSSPCNSLADLTGDGRLDFFDISQLIVRYNADDLSVDFTGDGRINFFDISAFMTIFFEGC